MENPSSLSPRAQAMIGTMMVSACYHVLGASDVVHARQLARLTKQGEALAKTSFTAARDYFDVLRQSMPTEAFNEKAVFEQAYQRYAAYQAGDFREAVRSTEEKIKVRECLMAQLFTAKEGSPAENAALARYCSLCEHLHLDAQFRGYDASYPGLWAMRTAGQLLKKALAANRPEAARRAGQLMAAMGRRYVLTIPEPDDRLSGARQEFSEGLLLVAKHIPLTRPASDERSRLVDVVESLYEERGPASKNENEENRVLNDVIMSMGRGDARSADRLMVLIDKNNENQGLASVRRVARNLWGRVAAKARALAA